MIDFFWLQQLFVLFLRLSNHDDDDDNEEEEEEDAEDAK